MPDQTFNDDTQPISKTAQKKAMQELQKLGAALVELNDKQLAQMPLEPPLRDAILQARTLKQREARRRQLQFIGKLMRSADGKAIAEAHRKLMEQSRYHIQHDRQAEHWRERLLLQGNSAVNEFMQQFPDADSQHLRQLLRGALKESQLGKPPAQTRKLFRYIRELLP